MMQFYIPEVLAVEQIDDEGEKLSEKIFREFEQAKAKETKEWEIYNCSELLDVNIVSRKM